MKVLLIGMGNKKLLLDIHHNLLKAKISAELLDPLEGYFIDSDEKKWIFGKTIISKNFFKKNILLYLNFSIIFKFFNKNNIHYDVCNIHFMDVRYFFYKKKLFALADKLVISIYGSDFYKYKKFSFFQKPFYQQAKRITFSNDSTLEAFDTFYQKQFHDKLHLSRFGISNVELIRKHFEDTRNSNLSKSYFNFPLNKTIITIGYHSNPVTQQIEIIHEIIKINEDLKKNIFLVLPMTYGGFVNYKEEVEKLLKTSGLHYIIITKFMDNEEIVHLRIASDIMIHLPLRDQLSATMLEYLYTGNYVITGQWLPYKILDKEGVYYKRIPSLGELSSVVEDYLNHIQSIKANLIRNEKIILDFSSWDIIIKKWLAAYNL
jgi:hypothetical protein